MKYTKWETLVNNTIGFNNESLLSDKQFDFEITSGENASLSFSLLSRALPVGRQGGEAKNLAKRFCFAENSSPQVI